MTAYAVDVDELVAVVAAMGACGRDLGDLAADVDAALAALHSQWAGRAADAHAGAHSAWRASFAEMTSALAGLRSVGDTAQANYVAATAANVAMWEHLG